MKEIVENQIKELKNKLVKTNNLISMLERYDNTTLAEKIYLAKKTHIYFEREKFADDIRKSFKSDLLRQAKVVVGVNSIFVYSEDRVLVIPKYSSNTIDIMYTEDIDKDGWTLYGKYEKREFITTKDLDEWREKAFQDIDKLEKSFLSRVINKGKISRLRDKITKIDRRIKEIERENKEIEKHNNHLDKLVLEDKQFLDNIKEDIDYFKDSGFEIFLELSVKQGLWE